MQVRIFRSGLVLLSVLVMWGFICFAPPPVFAESPTPAVTATDQGAAAQKVNGDEPSNDFDELDEAASPPPVFDPLIGYNRLMTRFNDKVYFWVLKPLATGYARVAPEPVRLSVARFFNNLGYPVRLVNDMLQLKIKQAGVETTRFIVNTTAGVAGFGDPAKSWLKLESRSEDFGQTLGHYGIGGGFPLVLPFLGPSNLRDALARVPDYFLDPVSYLPDDDNVAGVNLAVVGVDIYERVNYVSLHLGDYEQMKNSALDWYVFLRNAYQQHREAQIRE